MTLFHFPISLSSSRRCTREVMLSDKIPLMIPDE